MCKLSTSGDPNTFHHFKQRDIGFILLDMYNSKIRQLLLEPKCPNFPQNLLKSEISLCAVPEDNFVNLMISGGKTSQQLLQ